MQNNPALAESEFDKSLSMKKIRQTVDLSGAQPTNIRGAIANRQSIQQNSILFKRGAAAKNFEETKNSKPVTRLVGGGSSSKQAGTPGIVT